MEQSYTVPEGVAAITVHAKTAPGKPHIPEYSKPHAITLDVFQINAADVMFQSTIRFEGEEGLLDAHKLIERSGWKLLAFNAFNFDYRILSGQIDVAEYLPRTIDVFYGLWNLINSDSIAKTGKALTSAGDLRFVNLFIENVADHSPRPRQRGEDLMLLWLQIMRSNEVRAGGRTFKLTRAAGLRLIGATPYFEDARGWADELIENGSLLGSPARGHEKERDAVFLKRYRHYR
ncbi:MAG: hypothetical protein JHD02_00250 [Thermoleophilaceae bacterium]|nr:hypothetical protein [Thermoleophilaceae bacterium]